MMRHNRALVVIVSLLLTLAFSACGGNSGNGGGNTVTLTFYHWIGADAGPVVQKIDQMFEAANPNIHIQFTTAPTDQYQTVIKTRLSAGDAPDVFGVFPGAWLSTYGAKPGNLRFEWCIVGEGARHGVQGRPFPFANQVRMHPMVRRNLGQGALTC